jgi:hypothetical protein
MVMGWDGDGDKLAQDFDGFQYTVASLGAKKGYVFGVAEGSDPDSKWTQVNPGARNSSDYGNVIGECILKNTDDTTTLYFSRSQKGAQFVSADRAPLGTGESVTLKGYAKLAIWNDDASNALSFSIQDAELTRQPNTKTTLIQNGATAGRTPLTADSTLFTCDSTYFTADATFYW